MNQSKQHTVLNERKWDQRAATFDQKRFAYFRLMQRLVIRMIDLRPGLHFLDIGCGTGWAVRYVASRLDCQGEFYGVDLSGEMIAAAQAQSQGCSALHFQQANSEDLPLEDDFFDYAICTNSFHHYLHPVRALTEIRRVLAPNGCLYILDLTCDDPFTRLIDARTRKVEAEHVRYHSSQEVRNLFAQAGFKCLGSRWITYPLKVHLAQK